MVQHDPAGKFSNAFTERLFGPNAHLPGLSGKRWNWLV
jgi:hypothetical protein